MSIVQDALNIMYCISSEMIRHLFQNWILCYFLMKMAKMRKRVSLQNLKAVTEWYKSVY